MTANSSAYQFFLKAGVPAGGINEMTREFYENAEVRSPYSGTWADYEDTATNSTPIPITSNTYSTLTNDGLGGQTTATYSGGVNLWDTSSNSLDLSPLSVGDQVFIRADIELNPNVNLVKADFRFWFEAFGGFELGVPLGSLDEGAGVWYRRIISLPIYAGSDEVRTNPIRFQAKLGSDGSARVNGWYIGVV